MATIVSEGFGTSKLKPPPMANIITETPSAFNMSGTAFLLNRGAKFTISSASSPTWLAYTVGNSASPKKYANYSPRYYNNINTT